MTARGSRARTNGTIRLDPAVGPSGDRILAAAATLFRTRGYAATSTRDLAKALGIQSASLYYHIRRKEDLLYALSVNSLERLTAEVTEAIAGIADPISRIETFVHVHLTRSLADRDEHAAMLFELRSLSGARRARVIQLRDAYQAIATHTISDAQGAGAFRRDVPAKLATLALLNLLNWSIFWYKPSRGYSPARLAATLSTIFLKGTLVTNGRRPVRRTRKHARA